MKSDPGWPDASWAFLVVPQGRTGLSADLRRSETIDSLSADPSSSTTEEERKQQNPAFLLQFSKSRMSNDIYMLPETPRESFSLLSCRMTMKVTITINQVREVSIAVTLNFKKGHMAN